MSVYIFDHTLACILESQIKTERQRMGGGAEWRQLYLKTVKKIINRKTKIEKIQQV